MTSPSGSEHVSRYRALAEFDNLIREAKKAQRALRELREEEAKLNAQSMAEDKKVAASKADRAKAEKQSADSAKRSVEDLGKNKATAEKAGEDTGASFTKGMGRKLEQDSKSGSNAQFLSAATKALSQAFAKAGDESGAGFVGNVKKKITKDAPELGNDSTFSTTLKKIQDKFSKEGTSTGNAFVQGFATKLRDLNATLSVLGFDKLDLDVDTEDAKQAMKSVELELRKLGHESANPQVTIDTTRALNSLRAIQKLFKDEVAEDIIKESKRIQDELKIIDGLPSGRAFKFWALTALSDMSRVFSEAEKGTTVFERLRRAAAAGGGGGGGNFIQSFVSGFDDFSEASSKLLQRLSRVSGELYRMPGLIGVIVSAIPALVSGIGALGGGALGTASALGSLSGLLAAGPGLIFAFIGAIGGTKQALGGMAELLKNARQAREQQAEAEEKARLGTEKALTATQKYELALKNLDPATQKVTEAFVAFTEAYAEGQRRVSEKFFVEIADQTERLNKLLPISENFFGKSASAVGRLADEGIRMLTSGPWKRDFGIIANENAKNIENMGKAGFALINVFRNIAVAAAPFTRWVTGALKDGAEAFAEWSAQARSDGTILTFLDQTTESAQILWQILKNLGNVVNSFFQSTVDQGQDYLRTLEDITGGWADVAEQQEAANSPLRKWMQDIQPVLTSIGALIRDLARGIAGLASDQDSISTMVALLDTLRTRVLPPILEILRQLNESGIAVTVTEAIGDLLDAIAKFLDSGATQALSVFVTVLASFAELLFNIAALPGISNVLGSVAAGVAAIAAVSVVARFTGLFKLWDFFTWMTRNKGNLSGAFADAARGAAGLSTVGGQQALPKNIPSTVGSVGAIGSEVLDQQAKATERVGNASTRAATQTGRFASALNGVRAAGGVARGALSSLSSFVGGPWGVALIGATVLVGAITSELANNKQEAQDTKDAFLALKNAYSDLSQGDSSGIDQLAQTDEKLRSILESSKSYGLSVKDVSGALNNQSQSLSRVNAQLDAQIKYLQAQVPENYNSIGGQGEADKLAGKQGPQDAVNAAIAYKKQINEVADAQTRQNAVMSNAADISRTYQDRLSGLTQEQVNSATAAGEIQGRIQKLSSALDTLSSATSSAENKSSALRDIINDEKGAMINATEATESWSSRMLDLKDSISANGRSLDVHSRAGLRNRDALEEAAKATRELYLQDIASGTPMDQALRRHQARIKELQREADKANLSKTETRKLIDAYGDVPDDVKTNIETQGYVKVYQQMQDLKALQASLQSGKSLDEAAKEVEQSKARANAHGYATGGPVYGQGTRTSDSIQAWLSNGEFVQPTDAVEYYGMPLMEALRTRKLDKAVIQEALPDDGHGFASGGSHSKNCPACASGGHNFAKGGGVGWPFPVDTSDTMIKKAWANDLGGLGGAAGGNGYKWQMAVLRQAFPGLQLISGFRPGARTLSGNRSYHSVGRAVDLPPRRDVAQWIRANYGARTKELITPYNDLNLHNGKPHRYTGAIWNQHNFAGGNAHDHWAFKDGGLVDLMKMMGMDNLAPSQQTPLPSTPRTLSPAASAVVNNSTDTSRTFGDVIINNPVPERAGDSIRDALYRTNLLF